MPTRNRRRARGAAAIAASSAFAVFSRASVAAITAQTRLLPVHSVDAAGPYFRQSIAVRVLRIPHTGRRPFLILLHGRDSDPAERARLALPVYPANARYFAEQGFVVFIPLRVGYGVSGGPDVEFTGECAFKRYPRGVAPALAQTRQLLEFARRTPYVDGTRGVIVGESFGGLVAIAAAASRLRGVGGVVNISGGDGGDSLLRPESPCRPDQLRDAFALYGRTSRIPSLWLYSANDRLWGSEYPRHWFAAFAAAGGNGTFTPLPADRNNGHYIFSRNAQSWHPAFEDFATSLGLAPRAPTPARHDGRSRPATRCWRTRLR